MDPSPIVSSYTPLKNPIKITRHCWPKETKPLVTICCVTYNHEKYIRNCLDGILMQETTFPVEILIHDDASTDNTVSIIKNYINNYKNLFKTIFQIENQYKKGVQIGKMLWKKATGDFIASCEGDDYWTDKKKLQIQIDILLSAPEYSMCFHNAEIVNEVKKNKSFYSKINSITTYSIRDLAYSNFIPTATRVFRNYQYDFPEIFSKLPAADWGQNMLVAEKGKIVYLPRCMSVYRIHSQGVWSRLSGEEMRAKGIEVMEILDKAFGYRFHKDFVKGINARKKGTSGGLFTNFKKSNSKKIPQKITAYPSKSFFISQPNLNLQSLDIYLLHQLIYEAFKSQHHRLQGRLLDVGCWLASCKQVLNPSDTGVSHYMGLEFADNPNHEVQPDLYWVDDCIPLSDASVDSALCVEVLEHCSAPELVLTEIYRVLRPNGVVLFTVPFLWPLHEVPYNQHRYTHFAIHRYLQKAGFDNIELHSMEGWDQSLAQVFGLWLRRRPMNRLLRFVFSVMAYPVYCWLIRKKSTTLEKSRGQAMIVGLWGTAVKRSQALKADACSPVSLTDDVNKKVL
ncbi:glycosyltransferase [Desulfobulbus alkaliphilus]|uniref:glycosyltransferase n=1 Tax=Desulfobulbus alkaliphilus TaxID=869814 RepID=UPI001962EE71|nr:glycosyltransferase [Desulfobulbus alkaliphilus]MBM9538564.1 glycosyltransferase [Desulfobulbus alkaliphilus]